VKDGSLEAALTVKDFHHHISGPEGAPWVIFLHGLFGFGANWRKVTPSFEKNYRVLLIDQRGHGRSVKPASGHYRPEDYASDLLLFYEEYGVKRAHIVGHSMGGRNALCFATTYPERVEKLVIEDIGPDARPEQVKKMRALLESVPVPFKSKLEAKTFLLNQFEDPRLGQYFYSNLAALENGQVTWIFDVEDMIETIKEGRSHDRWNEWFALQRPTLLVRGQDSDELDVETYQKMLHTSRVAQGVVIPHAGHWVHADQPEEFTQAVLKFLRGR